MSWSLVLCITFAAHNYDRHLRRVALTKVPQFKRAAHTESSSAEVKIRSNFLSDDSRYTHTHTPQPAYFLGV